jgi:hypothetical protein
MNAKSKKRCDRDARASLRSLGRLDDGSHGLRWPARLCAAGAPPPLLRLLWGIERQKRRGESLDEALVAGRCWSLVEKDGIAVEEVFWEEVFV